MPELGAILETGTRVLMVSNEHPENIERWPHDPSLANRVATGLAELRAASTMHVTSVAGTDLTIDLAGAATAGSKGWVDEPGDIAHWPGGLVLAFPAAGTVNGTVVLAPGDVNLTFKEYIREPIRLTVVDDHVTTIDGDGLDADLFRSYIAAFNEPEAYLISHVGWGMNPAARWESLAMWDKTDTNGTRAPGVRRQLLVLDRGQRGRRPFLPGPLRSTDAELHGDPRRHRSRHRWSTPPRSRLNGTKKKP